MNPRIDTIYYYANNSEVAFIAIFDRVSKTVVIKEHATSGISLTNSIEQAILALYTHYRGLRNYGDLTLLQDCGEEGIFKIDYDKVPYMGMMTGNNPRFRAENPKWTYFAKDLKAYSVLYGNQ